MERTWATPAYEDLLLDAVLDRVRRDLEIAEAEKNDPEKFSAMIRKEMLDCYHDPVYFIQNYLFTDRNPGFFSKRIETKVPFILFDYQIETIDTLLECVEKGESAFLEKSRQLGVSWIVCAFGLWGFLFRDWKILFLSQKEDFVDKIGDMQSLFQKIRFMVRELPKWMLPKGFSTVAHMPRLRIFKPEGYGTGSIVGESANNNAGTGGTYQFVFLDEFSKIENASSINTSVQMTTPSVFYNGTPLGKFNEHYRMRRFAVLGKMRLIRLHWSMNPMYSKEWYEWKTSTMTSERIAQELEISYDASVEGRVYKRFGAKPDGDCDFGKYPYDPYLPLFYIIDNSHGGTNPHAIIVAQTTPEGKIRIVDSHQFPSFTTINECASLLAKQPAGSFTDRDYAFLERIKNYKTGAYVSDPYDTAATWDDTSILKIYRNYGITLNVPNRKKPVAERIRICTVNLQRIQVNCDMEDPESLNWDFVSALQSAHYPPKSETSQSTSTSFLPVHDMSSHFRSGFEYLVNFVVEAEEALGIVGGKRQSEPERVMVQVADYVTGETKWVVR